MWDLFNFIVLCYLVRMWLIACALAFCGSFVLLMGSYDFSLV